MSEIIIKVDANSNRIVAKRILAYEDVLKEIGFGRVQIEILFASFLVLLNVMNETMGISFIIPVAQCDMNLTESDKGLLSGIIFIAMIIPSYGWGVMAGSIGRRSVILWTVFGSSIFTCLAAFVNSFYTFLICRFMSGLFVAGYSGVIYTYIGEFCITKHRSIIISWASVSVGFGLIVMPFTASIILSHSWKVGILEHVKVASWRILLVIFATPGIIGSLWLCRMPESPKFLLMQNRRDEALEIVKWIYGTNKRNAENFDVDGLKAEVSDEPVQIKEIKGLKKILLSMKEQTLPLLKPPHLLYFTVCCCLQFGIFSIAGGFALFLPDILNKIANAYQQNQTESFRICDIMFKELSNATKLPTRDCDESINPNVFIDSMFLGLAYSVAYIAASLFMRPKRRKLILALTFFTSSVSGIILNYSQSQYLTIVLISSFIMLSGINSSIVNGVVCDIFPTKQLSTVLSITMVFGRIGTASASSLVGYLFEHDCALTYNILPVITLLCFGLSFILPT